MVEGLDPEDKLLLVCNKGKRAYLLQNRLKFYGYKHTKVLEAGITFNDVEIDKRENTIMACTIKPEDIKRVKALGFLNNKGTDLFNEVIITVNGKINAEQAAVIAEAAKEFGNGEVGFTVRLTVEVRGNSL